MISEAVSWRAAWDLRRYSVDATANLRRHLGRDPLGADFEHYAFRPYETSRVEGNLLTTAGLVRLTSLLIASGGTQALTNTATRIGVGNGVGTAVVGDTDLSASSGTANRFFQPADATFPSIASGVVTVQASFTSANGNFAWNEFGIDIGTPTVTGGSTVNACLLNHKTSIAQGTKIAGQTWVATATITMS